MRSKHPSMRAAKMRNQTAAAGVAPKLVAKVTASHVAMLFFSYAYLGLTHDTPIMQLPEYYTKTRRSTYVSPL